MVSEPIKVYWDACAWLGILNGETDKKAALEHVWEKAKCGEVQIWTSAFCIVEVHKVKCEREWHRISDENDDKINEMFDQPFVQVIQVSTEVARVAKQLLRTHEKLKKPSDAIHLASALCWDLDQFHTYDDDDFLGLNGKVFTANGSSIKICKADMLEGDTLFTAADVRPSRPRMLDLD